MLCVCVSYAKLTLALDALLEEAVQQRAAMIAECRRHKRVRLEAMRQIDLEAFSQILCGNRRNRVNVAVLRVSEQ